MQRIKATLTKGLTRLSNSINENKAQVDQLVEDLKKFRNKMTSDTQNFKEMQIKLHLY